MKLFGVRIPFLMFVSAIGIVGALFFSLTLGNPPPPAPNHLTLPPATPYAHTVSGTGLVEASSRNIAIGAFISGVVSELPITEGQQVNAGDVLYVIDNRSAQAELAMRQKELASAQATYEDESAQHKRLMSLPAGGAVSVEQQQRQLFAMRKARAQMEQAAAAVENAQVTLDKHTVRAPVAGQILKTQIRVGEFVSATQGGNAPVILGTTNPLHLRVLVDENDLWRFDETAEATAFLRSNKERQYALTFVRTEPLVQPKRDLSGDTRELVDTRVMEVIYAITPIENAPLYVGQQLDVFINADAKE